MSNVERIDKFLEDQAAVLTAKDSSSKSGKVNSEIGKLKQWLVKHQDDSLPDNSKAKIMTILEKYNRAYGYFSDIRSSVISLFSDYLQLPEGKLVNSKNKQRVLNWLQHMEPEKDENGNELHKNRGSISRWSVESINVEEQTVSLLSIVDLELWNENFKLTDPAQFLEIRQLFENEGGQNRIMVDIDSNINNIVHISEE